MWVHRFLLIGTLVAVGGCTLSRGGVPYHPRDDELINDGSPAQQNELRRRYRVATEPGVVHVGPSVRTRARVDGPFPQEWYPVHPEVEAYLSADKKVASLLPNRWLFGGAGLGAVVAGTLWVGAVCAVVASAFFATGFVAGAVPFRFPPLDQLPYGTAYQASGVALTLGLGLGTALAAVLLSVPAVAAGGAVWWWTDQQFVKAVDVYNQDLEERIAANARVPGAPQQALAPDAAAASDQPAAPEMSPPASPPSEAMPVAPQSPAAAVDSTPAAPAAQDPPAPQADAPPGPQAP